MSTRYEGNAISFSAYNAKLIINGMGNWLWVGKLWIELLRYYRKDKAMVNYTFAAQGLNLRLRKAIKLSGWEFDCDFTAVYYGWRFRLFHKDTKAVLSVTISWNGFIKSVRLLRYM